MASGTYNLPRDTSWQKLQIYHGAGISIQVPQGWLNLGGLGTAVEVAFDASGLYFPDTFNNRPVLAGVFILNQPGTSLEEATDLALKDYRYNTDRVFEPGDSDSAYRVSLQDKEWGYVLHTRFFRKSTLLNQSRYDLILFSDKIKRAYSVMVSVQYSDPSYVFEKNNALDLFAARLFLLVRLD